MCRTNYKFVWKTSDEYRSTGRNVSKNPEFSGPSLSTHMIKIRIIKNIQVKKKKTLFCNPNDDERIEFIFKKLHENGPFWIWVVPALGRFCIGPFRQWAFLVLGRFGSGAFLPQSPSK